MCWQEKSLEETGDPCRCSSHPDNEERLNRTEEIVRLKERKCSLKQKIAEVDRKIEDIDV